MYHKIKRWENPALLGLGKKYAVVSLRNHNCDWVIEIFRDGLYFLNYTDYRSFHCYCDGTLLSLAFNDEIDWYDVFCQALDTFTFLPVNHPYPFTEVGKVLSPYYDRLISDNPFYEIKDYM